jgi:hypothetical protein
LPNRSCHKTANKEILEFVWGMANNWRIKPRAPPMSEFLQFIVARGVLARCCNTRLGESLCGRVLLFEEAVAMHGHSTILNTPTIILNTWGGGEGVDRIQIYLVLPHTTKV